VCRLKVKRRQSAYSFVLPWAAPIPAPCPQRCQRGETQRRLYRRRWWWVAAQRFRAVKASRQVGERWCAAVPCPVPRPQAEMGGGPGSARCSSCSSSSVCQCVVSVPAGNPAIVYILACRRRAEGGSRRRNAGTRGVNAFVPFVTEIYAPRLRPLPALKSQCRSNACLFAFPDLPAAPVVCVK